MKEIMCRDVNPESLVVKSNVLIRALKYDLGELEQKVILIVLSKINSLAKADSELPRYVFDAKDICSALGLDYFDRYKVLRKAIRRIAEVVVEYWIEDEETEIWRITHFFQSAELNLKTNILKIEIDEQLKPYLLDLHKNFTQYKLETVLNLKGKYSLRIFEIIQSYSGGMKIPPITLKTIKGLLDLEKRNYKRTADFFNDVITPAVKDINEKTSMNITFEKIKHGKTIHAIQFYNHPKDLVSAKTQDDLNADELKTAIMSLSEEKRKIYDEQFEFLSKQPTLFAMDEEMLKERNMHKAYMIAIGKAK